ncbi:putative FBD domain, leucine-rich repeat domain superfamily [Helianthus anomalus]
MSYPSHKLPTSFFSLQNLTHLKLQQCVIPPLATLSKFGRLTSLCLYQVIEDALRFTQSGSSDFVDLFRCLPLIERLEMNQCPVKLFALGVIPPKLTNAIAHLKYLGLFGLSFVKEYELSSVFLLVSSSPNIKKIKLEMLSYASREVVSQTAKGFFDLLDYSDINLEHLCEIEITNFTWLKPEMDFVKVILAKSPMLANVQLMFDKMTDVQKRCWALEELLKLPRPSSKTKIIVKQ